MTEAEVRAALPSRRPGQSPADKTSPSDVSRVLRLPRLAPEIADGMLDGRQPADIALPVPMGAFPVEWKAQSERNRHLRPVVWYYRGGGSANPPGLREAVMRDGVDPWRTGDLVYLEREINYWTGPAGYQACAAGVQEARGYADKHGMDRVVVLPAWAARYDGVLQDIVAQIDPDGLVTDCDGAEIVTMPTTESLMRFVEWCRQHVKWQ